MCSCTRLREIERTWEIEINSSLSVEGFQRSIEFTSISRSYKARAVAVRGRNVVELASLSSQVKYSNIPRN